LTLQGINIEIDMQLLSNRVNFITLTILSYIDRFTRHLLYE